MTSEHDMSDDLRAKTIHHSGFARWCDEKGLKPELSMDILLADKYAASEVKSLQEYIAQLERELGKARMEVFHYRGLPVEHDTNASGPVDAEKLIKDAEEYVTTGNHDELPIDELYFASARIIESQGLDSNKIIRHSLILAMAAYEHGKRTATIT